MERRLPGRNSVSLLSLHPSLVLYKDAAYSCKFPQPLYPPLFADSILPQPAPLIIPPTPSHLKPSQNDFLSPNSPYLSPYLSPPPSASPRRVSSFILKLKKSTSQLRPTTGPIPSPAPSPLLSPSLFPLPPTRNEKKRVSTPFSNLAARSPRTRAPTSPWLELPPTPLLSPSSPGSTSSLSSAGWALTPASPRTPSLLPGTPYTAPKQLYSSARNLKTPLVFPHRERPRLAMSAPILDETEHDGKTDDFLSVLLSTPPPALPRFKKLPLPSPPPSSSPTSSPRRRSTVQQPQPATPPRLIQHR